MEKRFLNVEELAEYLGISTNTVYAWVCQRKIPYLKIGKLVKFDLTKIEQWLDKKTVKPIRWC